MNNACDSICLLKNIYIKNIYFKVVFILNKLSMTGECG